MDALSLLVKFLREMSLGLLFAAAAVALVITAPAVYFWHYVKLACAREKGVNHVGVHSRQPHRGDDPVVDKRKRGRLYAVFPRHDRQHNRNR